MAASALSAAGAAASVPDGKDLPLRRAAEQFETMFLAQILRDFTAGTVGSASGGEAGAFTSMLQDEYAKLISRSGGIRKAGTKHHS